jgi:hypothetical protein
MQLELTPLELNMLAVLYGAYVSKHPDEDEYTQQKREELAVKMSHFDALVQDGQAEQIALEVQEHPVDGVLLESEF